jgi:hypothetical protein
MVTPTGIEPAERGLGTGVFQVPNRTGHGPTRLQEASGSDSTSRGVFDKARELIEKAAQVASLRAERTSGGLP